MIFDSPMFPNLYWDGYLSNSQTMPPQGVKVHFSVPASSPENKQEFTTPDGE